MGRSPEEMDYIEGDLCFECSHSTFDDKTPMFVEAHINGIVDCFFPFGPGPNGVYLLQQTAAPCTWVFDREPLHMEWGPGLGFSYFWFFETITGKAWWWFVENIALSCQTQFLNANVCFSDRIRGRNGDVDIWWGPGIGPGD